MLRKTPFDYSHKDPHNPSFSDPNSEHDPMKEALILSASSGNTYYRICLDSSHHWTQIMLGFDDNLHRRLSVLGKIWDCKMERILMLCYSCTKWSWILCNGKIRLCVRQRVPPFLERKIPWTRKFERFDSSALWVSADCHRLKKLSMLKNPSGLVLRSNKGRQSLKLSFGPPRRGYRRKIRRRGRLVPGQSWRGPPVKDKISPRLSNSIRLYLLRKTTRYVLVFLPHRSRRRGGRDWCQHLAQPCWKGWRR